MEREQIRERETEGVKKIGTIDSKTKHNRSTIIIDAIVPSLAKEIGDFSAMDTNRAWSDRESRKDKYDDSVLKPKSRVGSIQLIHYGCG